MSYGQSSIVTYREGRAQQGGGREEEKASKAREQRTEKKISEDVIGYNAQAKLSRVLISS